MPRGKKQTKLGSPKGQNPMKEMSWCINRFIYVSCIPEAIKTGRYYEETGRYALTIKQGDKYRQSEFLYNRENVQDAIWDTYREIYKRNYGKETKE